MHGARKGELIGIAQPIVIRRLTTRPDLRSDGVGGSLQNIPRTMSPSVSCLAKQPTIIKSLASEKDVEPRTTRERVRHHRSHSEQRGHLLGSSSSSSSGPTESNSKLRRGEDRRGGGVGGGGGGGSVEGLIDSANEAFDESSSSPPPSLQRRPLYVDCAETGQRRFRLELDAEGFGAEDTTVTLMPGSRLEIRAVQEETEGGRRSTSEFSRRIKIPDDVDTRQMACVILDGRIRVEAPLLVPTAAAARLPPTTTKGGVLPPRPSSPSSGPLNTPVVRSNNVDGGGGGGETRSSRTLTLCVEVGRVFGAGDVAVKCRSAAQLIVCADRREVTDCSRLTASLVREFDLPERIDPHTLRAGITPDGLLKITAQVLSEEDPDAKNTTDRSSCLKEA